MRFRKSDRHRGKNRAPAAASSPAGGSAGELADMPLRAKNEVRVASHRDTASPAVERVPLLGKTNRALRLSGLAGLLGGTGISPWGEGRDLPGLLPTRRMR